MPVEETWAAELVLKVKEPIPSEYGFLRDDLTLFTYLHLAASRELTQALLDSGTTSLAYESVQSDRGALPLLAPMSEVAGRMAATVGAGATAELGAALNLTPAEARVHPRRNVITRALGSREALTVDVAEVPLASGDLVLLCSDGLTGELLDEEIRALIDDADTLEDALEKLIGAALWRGGRDNITAVLVRIP